MPRTKVDTPPERDILRETLADEAHKAWIRWMAYLSSKVYDQGTQHVTGEPFSAGCISEALVERWKRQMATPYFMLPEDEKQSDLEQADRAIRVMLYTVDRLGVGALLGRLAEDAKKAGSAELARELRAARKKVEK